MLGFEITVWDYLTFLVLFLGLVAFLIAVVFVLGLPGRIAIARRHPDADAVNMMGWVGFVAIVPWIQAFIWAFKPTNIVDIRYMPQAEQRNIDGIMARLGGKPAPEKGQERPADQPEPGGKPEGNG